MNRLGLKLGCLAVAIVIWIQMATTSTVEQAVRLPLRVVGLEEGRTTAGSSLPRDVEVRVQGSKLRLMAHRWLKQPAGEVVVDLSERPAGRPFTITLVPGDVVSDLAVTEIIAPQRLAVRIDGQVERRVPVVLSTLGSLPAGYGYLEPPRAEPESVLVSGPARYFPERAQVRTTPLELARLEGAGRQSLRLLPPEGHLHLSETEVDVSYSVGVLAERTIADVPVTASDVEEGLEVALSPARADVMVRGVADSLRALVPARLTVSVSASGLPAGLHVLPGEVSAPPWVTVIGLEPGQFQVVVGVARGAAGGRRDE